MARPALCASVLCVLLSVAGAAWAQWGSGPSQPNPGNRPGNPWGATPQPAPQYPQYPQQPYPQYPYPQAQVSLVGVWSTTLYDTQGRAIASIFIQFSPDGRYHKRMLVPAGQSDVYGIWQYDPQTSILQSQARDYAPRNLPPSEPMGQTYSLQVQWASPNMFVTQDVSGPIRWVRQQ